MCSPCKVMDIIPEAPVNSFLNSKQSPQQSTLSKELLSESMKAGIRNSSSVALLLLILFSCGEQKYISITGKTMGTYYAIQYQGDENYQTEIDSIFQTFISAASTYDTTSELSEFNRKGIVHFRTPYLYRMLSEARRINEETHGAFEPTLFPLVNAHGFGPSRRNIATQPIIDSLLSLVSINYIEFDSVKLSALKKGVQLDLNAMGEGFAIELIADFLERNNVHSYKVEIGGEIKCRGTNPGNELWLIGIEDPSPNGRHIAKTVRLQNESISTS